MPATFRLTCIEKPPPCAGDTCSNGLKGNKNTCSLFQQEQDFYPMLGNSK